MTGPGPEMMTRPGIAMARRRGRLRRAGFTLIEILVALVILAVALAATTRATGVATDGALDTRQRVLATWAAENRVAEIRARKLFPAPATTQFTTEQGGLALAIEEVVSETPNPTIRRVELTVAEARDTKRVITKLTAHVAR